MPRSSSSGTGEVTSIGSASLMPSPSCAGSACKDLSGVHQSVRIERSLDRPHHVHGFAELVGEVFDLAEPDAVLAGAGAVHGDGAGDHAGLQRLGSFALLGPGGIDQDQHVEIAVAD